jgi:hypothetical protein
MAIDGYSAEVADKLSILHALPHLADAMRKVDQRTLREASGLPRERFGEAFKWLWTMELVDCSAATGVYRPRPAAARSQHHFEKES